MARISLQIKPAVFAVVNKTFHDTDPVLSDLTSDPSPLCSWHFSCSDLTAVPCICPGALHL